MQPTPQTYPPARPKLVTRRALPLVLALLVTAAAASRALAQSPAFSGFVVFGDSLSDVGDRADRSQDVFNLRFPTWFFNYTDGRFTSGPDTRPRSRTFKGLWHEQLAKRFLGIPKAKPSLEGGTDFAFADGRTSQGTHEQTITAVSPLLEVTSPPNPIGTPYTVTIDDMGKQVSDYLASVGGKADPDALYCLWGGNNDLASVNPTAAGVQAAVTNEAGLVRQLALAGARRFVVVNVPPLGSTPTIIALGPQIAAGANQLAAGFRGALPGAFAQLQGGLAAAGVSINVTIVDSFAILVDAIAEPGAYGFATVTANGQNSPDPRRDDADRYLFWDGFHPTASGHYQVAAEAFADLSGLSVVQVYGGSDASGSGQTGAIFFTRTGENLASPLTVSFSTGGNARSGRDFGDLGSSIVIPAGARHVALDVGSLGGGRARTLTVELNEGNGYFRGVRNSASINVR